MTHYRVLLTLFCKLKTEHASGLRPCNTLSIWTVMSLYFVMLHEEC